MPENRFMQVAKDSDPSASEPVESPRFLSRLDVARLFGVSPSTVTRWARQGLLQAVRTPGGHYRFPAAAMGRAAREARTGGPKDPA